MSAKVFYRDIESHTMKAGLSIGCVNPFTGTIRKVQRPMNCFSFRKDGKNIMVKMVHQQVSGSASDKVPLFYLNLENAPYDKVYLVLNEKAIDSFSPFLSYFKKKSLVLDKVQVVSTSDYKAIIH